MKFSRIQLNTQQQEAVSHKDGPLLIIAGAGTGKTTVVTERIKYIIAQRLAKPEELLALTFTEKAAHEMEMRVDVALDYGSPHFIRFVTEYCEVNPYIWAFPVTLNS